MITIKRMPLIINHNPTIPIRINMLARKRIRMRRLTEIHHHTSKTTSLTSLTNIILTQTNRIQTSRIIHIRQILKM